MNLGKPRRRLDVAQRPSVDVQLDQDAGSDAPTDTAEAADSLDAVIDHTDR